VKTLTVEDLRALDRHAASLPRLRTNFNLHDPAHDRVQRFVVQLRRGTYVRPHCHRIQQRWECAAVLDGAVDLLLFEDDGRLHTRLRMGAFEGARIVELPPDAWHSYAVISESATFFEVKEGPYAPLLDKEFAAWAPPEGDARVPGMLAWMATAAIGAHYR
jgi:cupin fold WbuC family metalloprotein